MFSRNVYWYWELNISLTNSKMENRLLEDTSMPWFPEKPIKKGSWQSHRHKYQCVWKHESEDEFTQDQYNRCIYH